MEFKKALAIDPYNKFINLAFSEFQYNLLSRPSLIKQDLVSSEKYAKKHHLKEIEIYDSKTYYYLKSIIVYNKKYNGFFLKSDEFDNALYILKKRRHRKYQNFLKELIKRQQMADPNNALYNYWRALIYFRMHENKKALQEIQKGMQQKFIHSYIKEKVNAEAYILEKINFPWTERLDILTSYVPISYIGKIVVTLDNMALTYEKNGQFKKAKYFYNMSLTLVKQCKKNSFLIANKISCLMWEKTIYKYGLLKLYKKEKKMKKIQQVKNIIKKINISIRNINNLLLKSANINLSKSKIFYNQFLQKGDKEALQSLVK